MNLNKLEGTLAGLLLVAIAMVGLYRERAFLLAYRVERKKEPVGFWITITVQAFLGLYAVIYSLAR